MAASETSVPDIDDLYQPTHDERSRHDFISVLRNFAKRDMRDEMEHRFESTARPAFESEHGRAPETGREVAAAMSGDLYYRFYSSIRYNSQEMMYLHTMDPVERKLPEMIEMARRIAEERPTGGSLELNPDMEIPRYVTALDIHLAPGCFHSEYVEDDVAQGMLLAQGGGVAFGANVHRMRDAGGVGRSIGYYLTQKYPDFRPERILDIGTQSGKNLLPYLDFYPDAEAHAVDVGPATLRYGHAKAEHAGKAVHFRQMNAEHLDYPDQHFDLIVSSFFFHELPVTATKKILAHCRRLLRPGGIMAHMELPPQNQCDPYLNFYWDWDTRNNNEPFYEKFRSQDFFDLMTEAGFERESCFTTTVPDVGTFDKELYPAFLSGEVEAPLHGRGGWFIFGAKID